MEQLEQYPDLVRLRRTLKRSEGMFSLFFAECNLPRVRQQLIANLQDDFRLCVIDLAVLGQSSLAIDQVLHHALQQQPDAEVLCVVGLEHLLPVLNRDELLDTVRQMNWRRNQYRDLARPLVLWLPSFALRLLSEQAPDFYDWYSGVYRFSAVMQDQQLALQQVKHGFNSPTGVAVYQRKTAQEIRQQVQQLKGLLADSHRPQDQAYLTNQLATLLQSQGEYNIALNYIEQSRTILEKIGDSTGIGITLNNFAQIYQAQGDYTTALDYLKQSLKLAEETSDRAGVGTILNNLSQIYQAQGNYATALDYCEQSLKIRAKIGDRAGMGGTLNNFATIAYNQGDYNTALSFLEQSLRICEETGDRLGVGVTLNNLSQIYDAQGDHATALEYLQQSLRIREEAGDRAGIGVTLNNLSQIYYTQGDYVTALEYLQQSLKIGEEIGDRAGMGVTLFNLGMLSWQRNAIDTALHYWAQAKHIALKTQVFELITALQNLEKQLELPTDWSEKWLQTDQ